MMTVLTSLNKQAHMVLNIMQVFEFDEIKHKSSTFSHHYHPTRLKLWLKNCNCLHEVFELFAALRPCLFSCSTSWFSMWTRFALTITAHAERQALLQTTVLAAVPVGSVDQAVPLPRTRVHGIVLLAASEKALQNRNVVTLACRMANIRCGFHRCALAPRDEHKVI